MTDEQPADITVNHTAATNKQALRRLIDTHFNGPELVTLCFDLDVDYESLPGQGKSAKVTELILAFNRLGRLPELVRYCRRERPNVQWDLGERNTPTPAGSTGGPPGGVPISGVVVGQPPPLAAAYQTRGEARTRIEAAWAKAGTSCLLLSGDGGVGKSQLAAGIFSDAAATAVRVWVPAASLESLLAGYAAAATAVGCPAADDPPAQARAFLQWLAGHGATLSWLIVLDDLGLDPHQMAEWWPPTTANGRVLVTTRRRDAAFDGHGRTRIRLGVYTPAEAVSYLTDRLSPHLGEDIPEDAPTGADGLAKNLGFLPVALAQAAAVIIDDVSTCAHYRQRFADRATSLSALFPTRAAADTYNRTVTTTWSLAIEKADQIPPAGLARPAAAICAVTHPDGAPADLWTTTAIRAYLTTHRTPASAGGDTGTEPVSFPDAEAALRALHRLSIVTIPPGGIPTGVRIHALAQRAIWDTLTEVQREETIGAAADALLDIWPEVEDDTTLAGVLRANTTRLVDLDADTLWCQKVHRVLFRLGTSLGEAGLAVQARDYFKHLIEVATSRLGPDHPDTLTARDKVADWTGEAGDPVGAATAYADLLPDVLRVLGPDHPDTLETRGNLAYWTGEAGDPVGAATAFADLLTDQRRVLGPDHPDTLKARGNLADWRGEAGDTAGAAKTKDSMGSLG